VTTVIEGKGRDWRAKKSGPHSTAGLRAPSRPWPALILGDLVKAQAGRAILWTPLAVMAGAAGYFALGVEPPLWAALTALALFAGISAWAALFPTAAPNTPLRVALAALAIVFAAFAAAAAGFVAADLRTRAVAAPRIERETGPVAVEGWVVDAAMGETRPRLTLRVRSVEGMARPPYALDISTTLTGALQPGRAARCLAVLRPIDGPLAPGAYDAAFAAWFEQVGGGGFSYGACRPALFGPPQDAWDALGLRIVAWRRAITETIANAAPGQGGAVASALVTGDRSLINSETNRVFRDSGLGHMLSVSGLHMGLVAGMIYGALHLGLALIAPLALRFPIRKWAATAAILGTGAYLILSGNSVPAQRSFVMIAVAMGAILIDRPAITMRGLAVAALIVTLMSPEAVLSPGFQMSFAASAALVAAFEAYTAHRKRQPVATPGMLVAALQTGWGWLSGALLASAVAGTATDPFALMHFQRFTLYALPTNLIATPITSLILGPAAVAGGVLSGFGFADWAWALMGGALDFLIAAAGVFADRPEAVRYLPRPPEAAFLLWTLAVCWACLWRGPLRAGAIALALAGVALYAAAPQPMLWVDGRGDALLARASTETGPRWFALYDRTGRFEAERVGQLAGLSPAEVGRLPSPEHCIAALCSWKTPAGRMVFLVRDAAGLDQACVANAIVVARVPSPPDWRIRCRTGALVTPDALTAKGGAAMTETPRGVETRFALSASVRPWALRAPR
jgi:competence protein ComEC